METNACMRHECIQQETSTVNVVKLTSSSTQASVVIVTMVPCQGCSFSLFGGEYKLYLSVVTISISPSILVDWNRGTNLETRCPDPSDECLKNNGAVFDCDADGFCSVY